MNYTINFVVGFLIGSGIIIYIKKDKLYNKAKQNVKDMLPIPEYFKK